VGSRGWDQLKAPSSGGAGGVSWWRSSASNLGGRAVFLQGACWAANPGVISYPDCPTNRYPVHEPLRCPAPCGGEFDFSAPEHSVNGKTWSGDLVVGPAATTPSHTWGTEHPPRPFSLHDLPFVMLRSASYSEIVHRDGPRPLAGSGRPNATGRPILPASQPPSAHQRSQPACPSPVKTGQ
jgi:hypothetical protein